MLGRVKRTVSAAVSVLTALLALGACSGSSGADEPDAAPRSAAPTSEPPASESAAGEPAAGETVAKPALALITGSVKSRSCFTREVPRDLAWFDVQWKAREDLDEFSFDLVGADGVSTKGSGFVVPPVNFGGRIHLSGSATWEGWRKAVDSRLVTVFEADPVVFWSPAKGQTGLLVLHLVFDQEALRTGGASFDGIKATYTTADGETGEVTVDTRQRFAAGDAC